MPSFIPVTPLTPGTFTARAEVSAIINSTYGELGGTYGAIHYVYGGFQIQFTATTAPAVEVFGPSSSSSGAFTAVPAAIPGVFTPAP